MRPRQLKALQTKSRALRAQVIRPAHATEAFVIVVNSGSTDSLNHLVTVRFGQDGAIRARCTCPWAEHGGIACCHVIAALNKLAERKHRRLSYWLTPEEAHRQKKALFHLSGDYSSEAVWITSRSAASHSA